MGPEVTVQGDEVEQIRRMVDIQRQIVELARQNEIARKQCETLREEQAREARRLARRGLSRQPVDRSRWRRRVANALAALLAAVVPPRLGM
jgi:hypothetical protein